MYVPGCWSYHFQDSVSDKLAQEVVFSWNASNYVAVDETYNTIANVGTEAAPFDYFHINSVDKDANGDYLVSSPPLRFPIDTFLIAMHRFRRE